MVGIQGMEEGLLPHTSSTLLKFLATPLSPATKCIGAENSYSRACAIIIRLILLSVVQTDVLVLEMGWTVDRYLAPYYNLSNGLS